MLKSKIKKILEKLLQDGYQKRPCIAWNDNGSPYSIEQALIEIDSIYKKLQGISSQNIIDLTTPKE